MSFDRILPVVVSILVIISVAVLRQYSKQFAAIAATMPINIPLGLWIVYAGENGDSTTMTEFTRTVGINLIPTLFFVLAAWFAFRAGWTLIPVLVVGYAAWAVTLAISMLLRNWLGF